MNDIISIIRDYGLQTLITIAICYMIGSISFAIIYTRLFEKKDIRKMGSGNAGATNVLRSAGKKAAMLTFICDFSKGLLAVIIGKLIFINLFPQLGSNDFALTEIGAYIAGLACILGHIYPCWFNFRGGKGVLTSSAIILLIDWRVFCICISVFIIVILASKIVSLSSIIAAAFLPLASFYISFLVDYLPNRLATNAEYTITYVVVAVVASFIIAFIIIIKHKSNIIRLINGTEKKISFKK